MKKTFKQLLLLICLVMIAESAMAQINIDREVLFKLPPELSYSLLGMRVATEKVVMMNNLGRMVSFDLNTGESFSGRIKKQRIIDFDLILGQPIYLNEEGLLGGQMQPEWPRTQFSACRIENGKNGLYLCGGEKMIFLGNNATQSVEVGGLNFVLPVSEGFLWSIGLPARASTWVVSLFDSYGNLMKEIYRFSPEFDPVGLEIGPLGEEDEVLVSCYENNQRKIALIGKNGHMLWKINGPEKFCDRDLAFDGEGNLLVLEKTTDGVVLSRWKFAAPQG
jgi:hypothetical protein